MYAWYSIVIVAVFILASTPISTAQSNPSFLVYSRKLPFSDIGPLAPAVVDPGGCFIAELTENYAIKQAYIWQVKDVNGLINLYNYTVSIERLNDRDVKVCVPRDIEEGVYDIELVAETKLSAPRSLWVVKSLPKNVRIVAMSDLHFGTGPGVTYIGDFNRYTAAVVANSLNPTIVLWSGDITESGSETQTQMAQTYRYMMFYKYPVFGVGGNHDYPGHTYRAYLGPTRWARVINNKLLIIGIYTTPYDTERNIITWDEIVFLENALKNYSYIPFKIVVTHYPMFYYQGELTTTYDDEELLKPYSPGVSTPVSSYWSTNITAFRYVLKLIEEYGVNIVLSGHIHVDQFVKYTSRRTNKTTYFITITTAAHGTSTYRGITVFDLDLETGELAFPIKPPGFIGFANNTERLARNSIPLMYFPSRLIRAPGTYKLVVSNQVSWLNISLSTIMAFPWSSQFKDIRTYSTTTSDTGYSQITDIKVVENTLFVSIRVYCPRMVNSTIIISGLADNKPPRIELRRYLPSIPTLNRTFTLYIDIVDDEWGLDYDNVIVRSNITQISLSYSPETIVSDLNKITLTITLNVIGSDPRTIYIDILAIDNSGKSSTKRYIVNFYPPNTVVSKDPVYEYIETPITTTTPTETMTPTAIPSTTYTETSTMPTVSTPNVTTTESHMAGTHLLVIIVVIIVVISLVIYLKLRKK